MKITEKEFRVFVRKWHKEFKLNRKLKFERRDNMQYACAICYDSKNKIDILRYKLSYIKHIGKTEFIMLIFHELGHLVNNFLPKTVSQRVKSEYLAEKFALQQAKKHFNISIEKAFLYKECIYNFVWQEMYPIHAKAFKKLYEEIWRQ